MEKKEVRVICTNLSEGDKISIFRLTHAQKVNKMETLKGQEVTAERWVLYSEFKTTTDEESGEVKNSHKTVFCMEHEGQQYGTISPTFVDGVSDFLNDLMGSGPYYAFRFRVGSSKSKAGRTFLLMEPLEVFSDGK